MVFSGAMDGPGAVGFARLLKTLHLMGLGPLDIVLAADVPDNHNDDPTGH